MENSERTVKGWINPLMILSLDEDSVNQFGCEDVIRDFFADGDTFAQNPVDEMKQNYAEISSEDFKIFLVPPKETIMSKIVWPLRTAKKLYCLSDYLGCIARVV